MSETGVVVREQQQNTAMTVEEMSPSQVLKQMALIQEIMQACMKEGKHYGVIPGCDKPSLYQDGAEKICLAFRLQPDYDVLVTEHHEGGHRTFTVKCTLKHIQSGLIISTGIGIGSTLESKYRYRTGPVKDTGKPVPKEYWNCRESDPKKAMELLGGPGHSTKKIDGAWHIVEKGERVEHDNPADFYNTAMMMGCKRAYVKATRSGTAASDIFTQDIEDLKANGAWVDGDEAPPAKPPIKPPQERKEEPKPAQEAPKASVPPVSPAPPVSKPKKTRSEPVNTVQNKAAGKVVDLENDEVYLAMPTLKMKELKGGKFKWCGIGEDRRWYSVWRGSEADAYNRYAGQKVIIKVKDTPYGPDILNVRLPDAEAPQDAPPDGDDAAPQDKDDIPY